MPKELTVLYRSEKQTNVACIIRGRCYMSLRTFRYAWCIIKNICSLLIIGLLNHFLYVKYLSQQKRQATARVEVIFFSNQLIINFPVHHFASLLYLHIRHLDIWWHNLHSSLYFAMSPDTLQSTVGFLQLQANTVYIGSGQNETDHIQLAWLH